MNTYIRTKTDVNKSRLQTGVPLRATVGILTPTLAGYRNLILKSSIGSSGCGNPIKRTPITRGESALTKKKRSLSSMNSHKPAEKQIPTAGIVKSAPKNNSLDGQIKGTSLRQSRKNTGSVNQKIGRKDPMEDRSHPRKEHRKFKNFPPPLQSVDKPTINPIQRIEIAVPKGDLSSKDDLFSPPKKTGSWPSSQKDNYSPAPKTFENRQTSEYNYAMPSLKDDLFPPARETDPHPSSLKDNYSPTNKDNQATSPLRKDDLSPMLKNEGSRPSSKKDNYSPAPKKAYKRPPTPKDNCATPSRRDDLSPMPKKASSRPTSRKENCSSAPAKGDRRSSLKNDNNRENYFCTRSVNNMQKAASEERLDSMDDISSWGNQDDTLEPKRGTPDPLDVETKMENRT